MNAFQQASEIEKAAEAILLPFMQDQWPDCIYYATRHHALVQKFDGDFLVSRFGKERRYIEIKAEQTTTGNLFIETWSNKSRKTLGWFHLCQADWLWYFFLDTGILVILPMAQLREWARVNGRLLDFPERQQRAYAQLNDTWGRLVPIAILTSECRHVSKHTVNAEVPQ